MRSQFISIWSIDSALSGATSPGQSGPGSDGNEGVLCIPKNSSITGASPSNCLVSYPGYSLAGSYPSAEMKSVYSAAAADWNKRKYKQALKNNEYKTNLVYNAYDTQTESDKMKREETNK